MSDALAYALRRAVRAERHRAGLSQEQLADRIGWARSSVAAMEGGTRRIYADELGDLCRGLGVPLSRLLVDAPAEDRDTLGG